MNAKKVISVALVSLLSLSTFVPAFAADYAFKNTDTGVVYEFFDYAENVSRTIEIGTNLNKFAVEIGGKYYSAEAVNEKMAANENLTIDEAVVGLEPIDKPVEGELKVVEVSAINSTVVEIKLNQKVKSAAASNIYLGITESSVSDTNLDAITGNTGDYVVTLVDGDTIRISGKTATDVIWEDLYTNHASVMNGTGDALAISASKDVEKNKTTYIQLRNLRDVNGKLLSTVQTSFDAVDTVAPKLVSSKYDATNTKIVLTFDEPVYTQDAKFYIEDKLVSTSDVAYATGKYNVVEIALSAALDYGKYSVDAVGVLDLAGNYVLGNIHSGIVEVTKASTPDDVKAEVLEIKQTDDGKFNVFFNTTITSANVTIKNLVNNEDFKAALSGAGDPVYKLKADGSREKDKNGADIILGYNYEVEFANVGATSGAKKFEDVYNTSNEIRRTIDVTDIVAAKNGDDKSFVVDLKVDLKAPTASIVANSKNEIEADDEEIIVLFDDAPWGNGVVFGNSHATDGYDIVVKVVNKDGETKSATFNTKTDTLTITPDNKIVLDLSSKASLYDEDGDLILGEYSVILPRGIVTDNDVPNEQYRGPFQYVGGTLTVNVVDEDAKGESAPQTAQKLVSYNTTENAIYVYFIGADIDAKTATKPSNYTLAGKTLTSDSTFEYTTIKDLTAAPHSLVVTEKEGALVKIFLENNTIAKEGQYTLTVENVATKTSGAKMQPAEIQVADLKDNTAPVMTGVKITGTAQIEVTFNEAVTLETGVERNFTVNANGRTYDAESVTVKSGTGEKVIVVNTKEEFSLNPTNLSVTLDLDQNDDMFVLDTSDNKAETQNIK